MPANLPPIYFEAEKRFRDAKTPESKIEALEEMLTIMPKHKGTDKLRADLRRRIAKLKEEAQQKKGGARRDTAYVIEKEGASQIAVIGAPNTGKSALVAGLTNATPEVAVFPHTTWKPTPGMAPYDNIQFQLVDTPPITRDYLDPWMADLMRRADMLLVMLDLHADPLQQLEETLAVLQDLRIFPEGFPIPGELRKPPFIKKTLVVMNKVDTDNHLEDYQAFLELTEVNLPSIAISLRAGWNLKGLLELLYQLSEVIRVYTKVPGKEPNRSAPFVLAKMTTLEELAAKIHKDFVNKLKFAKIWGPKVYDGQMVQRDYVLQEGDVVEIHL
jgi:uncharacterized protein